MDALLSRAFGSTPGISIRTGLCLAQAGEFGFVLLNQIDGLDLIDPALSQAVLAAMLLSMFGAIADSVKDCLRCGKCKPVCSTHVPRANLLYSPRDKILATSLLIEAFLYEKKT